jgi:preprotein translocase subunit SecE
VVEGEFGSAKAARAMSQAAKLNKDEANGAGVPFSVPGPVSKLAQQPKRLREFLHDVRVEMRLVNWPSRQDVISTTIVVVVTVAFFGIFFFMTDRVFSGAVGWLIHYVKH